MFMRCVDAHPSKYQMNPTHLRWRNIFAPNCPPGHRVDKKEGKFALWSRVVFPRSRRLRSSSEERNLHLGNKINRLLGYGKLTSMKAGQIKLFLGKFIFKHTERSCFRRNCLVWDQGLPVFLACVSFYKRCQNMTLVTCSLERYRRRRLHGA
jgi:hypothetical protein